MYAQDFFYCLYTGIWMHAYGRIFYGGIRIITAASAVEKERSRRLTTSILNQVVQEALAFKSPPRTRGGKRGRVYYCTQVFITKGDSSFGSMIYSSWFRMKVAKLLVCSYHMKFCISFLHVIRQHIVDKNFKHYISIKYSC